MGFQSIVRQSKASTFAFSPENSAGVKNGGSRGEPWEKVRPFLVVKPGETVTLADVKGPGTIQSMWFGGYNGWNFILRIYWDGQEYPSVEAPLCAFFGYGFHNAVMDADGKFPTLDSAAVLVAPCRGMNCYWQMPFRKHCRITLENRSLREDRGSYYMITGQTGGVPDDCAYFHAAYRQERPVALNHEYIVIDGIRGTGQYVGTALFAGLNGSNGCWVEGEAKMFIDGDVYPSVNYTGTEDYFGGSFAWGYDDGLGRYQSFSGQFVGMYAVLGDYGSRYNAQSRFMAYRWHIPDPIHFSSDFRMTLQNLGNFESGQRSRRDDYATVAYWYQSLPSVPLVPLPEDAELDMQ
jgi:hypothetical protein